MDRVHHKDRRAERKRCEATEEKSERRKVSRSFVDLQIAERQNVDLQIADIKMWTSPTNLT
jgi:hypothetical protein